VTKTFPAENISECLRAGIKDIGESRIQEAEGKFKQVEGIGVVKKHLIGHLQTNKAKKAVELFDVIQSLDSERLAVEINKAALAAGKVQDCLLEIKVSEEESKFGIAPEGLRELAESAAALKNIRILGIMGMAPFFENPEQARPYFAKLRKIFDEARAELKLPGFETLSMGMSHDFEIAVEEGSTMVRIGTAIFKD
jgi:pyridoxal phosphate enzyme (YggS family)